LSVSLLLAAAGAAHAGTASFSVIYGGKTIGRVVADTQGDTTTVEYDVKNNGRGPTIAESITLDAAGLPTEWTVKGTTTFGSKIAEHFSRKGTSGEWVDSTGRGHAAIKTPSIYLAQSSSPWANGVYARALLKTSDKQLPALPGGVLRLEKGETLEVQGNGGPLQVTRYDLIGIDLDPETILLDSANNLFADVNASSILVRAGYEAEEKRLRDMAAAWSSERFVKIEHDVAHRYAGPIRIRHVRLFDPKSSSLTEPVSVLVQGKVIAAVEPNDSPPTPGETTIDGAGGTLIAGMYEMHAHLGQNVALLNVAAGITSVRDMGNDNAVLEKLIHQIDSGAIGGPHVIRSGFIEGKSPFSANNGILVDSQSQALDAVRWYGARNFWQIK